MKVPRSRLLAALVAAPLLLTGCSAGSLGSSSDDAGGGTTITFLVDTADSSVKPAEALAEAFHEQNPDITVEVETRPGGTDGDNLVKTRLSTGTMDDVFLYNSGSLFQQIDPAKNLVPITDQPYAADIDESFKPNASAGGELYGAPIGTAMGGGVLYNRDVYSQLGLSVPTTWQQFIENSQKIKDSGGGVAPVVQTYGDTWTSQLFVLGDFHNVAAAEPTFADDFTANKAKFATDPAALKGFEHLQQVHDAGLTNTDFASATLADGLRMVADGTGAQYPMLSAIAAGGLATAAGGNTDSVGFFALPGDDAASNGLTAWYPAGAYIPKSTSGAELEAAKAFLGFIASPAGCDAQTSASAPTGPYLVSGCELPSDTSQLTKDVVKYFDDGKQSPALEFLSPVKGPSLEQITVQVGSGISTAAQGAALYDQDVEKQAQQLGLAGW
ncbi:carbohydrate ABC transporter substrate-binding protein [Streptomyces sp. NP160]|uniref:ABC transporter substrate-binding protein n=1 Tax=Streptomyces sp. NP160 TaxID=2586637 RepID=UPI00111B795B|nr:ABC transporter substrate-binding protein [Streptomyces sp. NP160]TNM63140.1 carbohydrate ABC transporter substrate-binding protein [Streptomyces sp. NP160]